MSDMYRIMYTTLFTAVTDALEDLAWGRIGQAESRLQITQKITEDIYISCEKHNDPDEIVEIFGENVKNS